MAPNLLINLFIQTLSIKKDKQKSVDIFFITLIHILDHSQRS